MKSHRIQQLSYDELRSFVLEAFKTRPQITFDQVCSEMAELIDRKHPNADLQRTYVISNLSSQRNQLTLQDQERTREIIWDLIIERIVTIGTSGNPSWPWLKLTDYGQAVLKSSLPVPHDPSGFLKRLEAEIPTIDQIIYTYLQESLRTYNIGALLSSTITLGCASEKALLLLIDSYYNAIQDDDRKERFKKDTSGKTIKRQFDIFEKNLNSIKGKLPGSILDGLDTNLLGIFEMIRNYRNDAGHPTGKSILREQVYANLQIFIPYCKKVYQLKEYFESNPIKHSA